MGLRQLTIAVVVVSCVHMCLCDTKKQTNAENQEQPSWTPVSGERAFSVNVNDKIKGASQLRQETWKDGAVDGYYASPTRNGKWLKVNYKADDKGYRVTSSEEVSEEQLTKGVSTADNTANVNIQTTDSELGKAQTAYTVKEADLLAANKANANKQKQ